MARKKTPVPTIAAAVARASGSGHAAGAGVAAGAGTSKARDSRASAISVGIHDLADELTTLKQRVTTEKQARVAGAKARQVSLADKRRLYVEQYWRDLDAGIPRHKALTAALDAMEAKEVKAPKSDRHQLRLFPRRAKLDVC